MTNTDTQRPRDIHIRLTRPIRDRLDAAAAAAACPSATFARVILVNALTTIEQAAE